MPTSGSAVFSPWALGNFFPIWTHFQLCSGSILSGGKAEPQKPVETSCYFVLKRHQETTRRYLIFSAAHMAINLFNLWSRQQKMKFWSLAPSCKTHFMRVRIQPMGPGPDASMQNSVMGWLVLKCLPGLDNCSITLSLGKAWDRLITKHSSLRLLFSPFTFMASSPSFPSLREALLDGDKGSRGCCLQSVLAQRTASRLRGEDREQFCGRNKYLWHETSKSISS